MLAALLCSFTKHYLLFCWPPHYHIAIDFGFFFFSVFPRMLFDNPQCMRLPILCTLCATERGEEIALNRTAICPLKKSIWRENKAVKLCPDGQISRRPQMAAVCFWPVQLQMELKLVVFHFHHRFLPFTFCSRTAAEWLMTKTFT